MGIIAIGRRVYMYYLLPLVKKIIWLILGEKGWGRKKIFLQDLLHLLVLLLQHWQIQKYMQPKLGCCGFVHQYAKFILPMFSFHSMSDGQLLQN